MALRLGVAPALEAATTDVPRPPKLGAALRQAAADLYFNSWRLAPANLLWAGVLFLVLVVGLSFVPAFVLVALVAIPTAGLHRLTSLTARGEPSAFSDVIDGMRRYGAVATLLGLAALALGVVFTSNLVLGLETGGVLGWSLATFAAYGDVALAMLLVAVWPVLTDPRREGLSVRRRLTLAGLVVVGAPGRMLALTAVIAFLLIVATVAVGAIALVGVAYTSLVASRYVLPLLDHLEARLPH